MDIIVLNAPPSSGKDHIADLLLEAIPNSHHREVKEMLFSVAIKAAGISPQLWNAFYDRRYKEEPCPFLMIDGKHVSPREWMIHCSEALIKPVFGSDAFGKASVASLEKDFPEGKGVVVYSDGGFKEELACLSEYAYSTGGDLLLFRIHRAGYDWGNDSRTYLSLEKNGIKGIEFDVVNPEGAPWECASEIVCKYIDAKEAQQEC